MFPIVFAAISGRSMKMIARYLAEKGEKLGVSSILLFTSYGSTNLNSCSFVLFLTNSIDIGTTDGEPVCVGNRRKPAPNATAYPSRRKLIVFMGIVSTRWSGVSSTHE